MASQSECSCITVNNIVDSSRLCAVRVSFDSVNLLIINVYMPYEDGDNHIDEFVSELTTREEIISGNSNCRVVLAGDFMFTSAETGHTLLYSIVFVLIVVLFPLVVTLPRRYI